MDRSDVIYLVKEIKAKDSAGIFRRQERHRPVFAQVESITQSEFHDAGQLGFKPELRFTIFAGDYDGEGVIHYGGRAYGVYRTYLAKGDNLELYAERKGGVYGSTQQ